jgi:hypothetical protein
MSPVQAPGPYLEHRDEGRDLCLACSRPRCSHAQGCSIAIVQATPTTKLWPTPTVKETSA